MNKCIYTNYKRNNFKSEIKFSYVEPNSKYFLNSDYIKRAKERGGILSNIIFELECILEEIDNISKNIRIKQLKGLANIYYSLEQILEYCDEAKDINIYQGKTTINKIRKELNWIKEFDFDEFYDMISENFIYGYDNYEYEGFEYENDDNELTLDDFIDEVENSIENMFKVIDKSYEYKKKRKKLRYRKKTFKKKSSVYFTYLYEGRTLEEIAELCDVQVESIKRFIRRKVKYISERLRVPSISNELIEKILIDLDITKEELEYFIIVYII